MNLRSYYPGCYYQSGFSQETELIQHCRNKRLNIGIPAYINVNISKKNKGLEGCIQGIGETIINYISLKALM